MEKQGRSADRVQRRLNKALRKKDLKRGKAVPANPNSRALRCKTDARFLAATSDVMCSCPEVYRLRRRLLRAKSREDKHRLFHVAELGTDPESAGVAVAAAPRRPGVDIAAAICACKLQHTAADPRGLLLLRTNEPTLHERLFDSAPGDTCVYVRVLSRASDVSSSLPLFLLCGSSGVRGALHPRHVGLDAALLGNLQTQALRLLGLIEVHKSPLYNGSESADE